MTRKPRTFRQKLRIAIRCLMIFLLFGVLLTHQFPGLISQPKTSVELLEDLFELPFKIVREPALAMIDTAKREAAVVFIGSCSFPEEGVKNRLVRSVRDERFHDETFPFILYLYDLYGARLQANEESLAELAYAEPAPEKAQASMPGVSALLRGSSALRRHATTALEFYDVLFLRESLDGKRIPPEQLEGEALEDLIRILGKTLVEFLPKSDDALSNEEPDDYVVKLDEALKNDEMRIPLAEFISDMIREIANSWLESYLRTAERRALRVEWVEERLAENRFDKIADYARARAHRKMVFHLAVDGLQGKLLEGLAELSMGDRKGSGALYVKELVEFHEKEIMDPGNHAGQGAELPRALGDDIRELVKDAPVRPDYLENFKKYFFSPAAQSVRVSVATSDTPTISVRNLPIIYSGHGVAGRFGTGIPNFSYLDRETGRGWYFFGSDLIQMGKIFGNHEDRIPSAVPNPARRPEGPGARTLFERLWRYNTVSCMAIIDTGALDKISSEVGVAVGEIQRNFIEKIIVLRFRQRAAMERELNTRRQWLMEHRNLSGSLVGSLISKTFTLTTFKSHARFLALHEDEGIPDYVLWYNPWPDHFAHSRGPYSDAIVGFQGEYDRLDFYLGKMIEIYESLETAGDSGDRVPYTDRTLFGVVSDHGLVYTPRLVSIEELLFRSLEEDHQGMKIKRVKLSADEGGFPVIHGREGFTETRSLDVVLGSTAGGSYVMDLFSVSGLEGNQEAWKHHPGYHELRQLKLLGGETVDWIEEIRTRLKGVLDVALVREYGPAPGESWKTGVESVVRIFTTDRGDARIHRLRETSGAPLRYRYEILGERDPLSLLDSIKAYLIPPEGPDEADVRESLERCIEKEEGCPPEEWSRLLSFTARPDVIHQFSHLYDSDRAGTINIFPVRHVGMNSSVPGRHAGESFGEKNATALFFGGGLKRGRIQTARNGSVPVTLYHWLVGDEVFSSPDPDLEKLSVSPEDQFGYPTLLREPAFAPIAHGGR